MEYIFMINIVSLFIRIPKKVKFKKYASPCYRAINRFMVSMPFKSFFPLLLENQIQWPSAWKELHWEKFTALCTQAQLQTLLYYRLRENPSLCPSAIQERLKNQFDLAFSHVARLKTETEQLSKKMQAAGLRLCFLKGYPLALKYYPHIASRIMQDIDCYATSEELELMKPIFKKQDYSILPCQSGLEHKLTFVKLLGPHVYSFEFHRSLYTSYLVKASPLPDNAFDKEGFPSPEVLFLSVLLHHRYYECSIRDLVDLQMIFLKHPNLDWELIKEFCQREKLTKHYVLTAELSSTFLQSQWSGKKGKTASFSFLQNWIKKCLHGLRAGHALWRPKKRDWLTKLLDAVLSLVVYDDFSTGMHCFWNRYIRYVVWKKYRMLLE
jgi:hypothetical protein